MSEKKSKRERGEEAPIGALAGVFAVVLIVAMVFGVGWVVLRVTGSPEPGPGVAYELRGERGTAGSPGEVLEAARVFLKDEKKGAAEKLLSRALEMWPEDQGLRFLYGETLLLLDRKVEAYGEYAHGIAIGPDHAEFRHAAGTLAADIGLHEEAEAHYLMAQKLNPESAKHPLFLAQVQRTLGKTDAARANLVVATKIDPDEPIAWGTLAGMALESNRLSPARTYIGRARELEPESALWRLVEARVERRDNNPERALDLLLSIDRESILDDPALLGEIALCYGLFDEPGAAAQWYVEAADRHDGDPEMLYEAARWLERSGQTERAKTYAHNAALLGHGGAAALLSRLEGPARSG